MAEQYGSRGGLAHVSPRVHLPVRVSRPPPQALASPPPPPPSAAPEPVSLQVPRPDTQRRVNEYVETPLRPVPTVCESEAKRTNSGSARVGGDRDRPRHKRAVVTEQPAGQTFEKPGSGSGASPGANPADQCSIICRECGRCRCEACRRPRPVPSLWLCHDFCLCSMESCVDYGSCLCCVKGLMYHCASRDGDDDTCADEPCSCAPDRRLGRWTCLGLASLALPCLCCYWPLRGLGAAAETLYGRCTSRGCRCRPPAPHTSLTPEKRLLDSSPEL